MGNLSGSNDSDRIPISALSDTVPMANDASKVPTSRAVYAVESSLYTEMSKKTSIRYCDNGVFKNGTPNTGDIIVFTDSVTTSGGSATFYATSDHTSTGTALCSSISADSFQPNYRDSTGIYLPGAVTVAGNLKSISQSFAKQTFTGITILTSINVLGSTSNTAIPDGVVVKAGFWGISV